MQKNGRVKNPLPPMIYIASYGKSHLTAGQSVTKPINEFNNNVKV